MVTQRQEKVYHKISPPEPPLWVSFSFITKVEGIIFFFTKVNNDSINSNKCILPVTSEVSDFCQ